TPPPPGPAGAQTARADTADSRRAHLPGPAPGRLRCGRGGRGDRTPRPAPVGGVRACALRIRKARHRGHYHTERRVQPLLGDTARRSLPTSRPPLRVDPRAVPGVGPANRGTIRLRRTLPPDRTGGPGS